MIFLIAVLILISLAPQSLDIWTLSSSNALVISLALYICLLALIVFQNRRIRRTTWAWKLANCEILLFFSIYYLLLGGQRLFAWSETASVLVTLSLYFTAITVYYQTRRSIYNKTNEVRLMLPLAAPFVILTALVEVLQYLPSSALAIFEASDGSLWKPIAAWGLLLVLFFGLLLIIMPPTTVWMWGCRSLPRGELRSRLEALCARASFRCADLKTWTVLDHSLTAAILGILPRFRYVLFTKRLLDEFAPEQIEAILAHEIGHHYHKHLLFYPVILLGGSLAITAFSSLWLRFGSPQIVFLERYYPSVLWSPLEYFIVFAACAAIFGLYFRYVFGFFSRLCERQADLHVFHVGLDPDHLIGALDEVGIRSGYSHDTPSWHHYSIKERMDFLTGAKQNCRLVTRHHHRVKLFIFIFMILLLTSVAAEVLWL